jgi:hypothetical protein
VRSFDPAYVSQGPHENRPFSDLCRLPPTADNSSSIGQLRRGELAGRALADASWMISRARMTLLKQGIYGERSSMRIEHAMANSDRACRMVSNINYRRERTSRSVFFSPVKVPVQRIRCYPLDLGDRCGDASSSRCSAAGRRRCRSRRAPLARDAAALCPGLSTAAEPK